MNRREDRVLILAPTGRDAAMTSEALRDFGRQAVDTVNRIRFR